MAEFKKINRSSVVQTVIDRLTEAMIRGELKPGDKIPTEMELSEQMGIARNSVREAVKILIYMGVLEIRRPEGTFVTNGFTDKLMDPMVYGIILNQQNETDLNELRATMEAGVMNLAIQKCNEEALSELKNCLDALKTAALAKKPDVDQVFECDNAFHQVIARMGSNMMVEKINDMVLMLTWSTRYETVKRLIEQNQGEMLYQAHVDIFKMIENKETKGLYGSIRKTYFIDC